VSKSQGPLGMRLEESNQWTKLSGQETLFVRRSWFEASLAKLKTVNGNEPIWCNWRWHFIICYRNEKCDSQHERSFFTWSGHARRLSITDKSRPFMFSISREFINHELFVRFLDQFNVIFRSKIMSDEWENLKEW
jgi:hypothetical protein